MELCSWQVEDLRHMDTLNTRFPRKQTNTGRTRALVKLSDGLGISKSLAGGLGSKYTDTNVDGFNLEVADW